MDVQDLFEKHEDEFIKFDRVPEHTRVTNRADINAFILLDKFVPGATDMVCSAGHDEIWLDVSPDDLQAGLNAAGLSEQDKENVVITLARCGVRYDSETDSLAMFV